MRLLVTGASGRLGSRLIRSALAQGWDVVALDAKYRADSALPIHVVDLKDRNAIYPYLAGCDAVAHLANSIMNYFTDQQKSICETVTMGTNVMVAACETGVRKIVFASTVQVGAGTGTFDKEWPSNIQIPYLPMDGNLPPNPSNPYATGKAMCETLLQWLCRNNGITGISIRFPYMFPREAKGSYIHRQRSISQFGHPPFNTNEGMSSMSYEDAANLVLACFNADLPGYRTYFPSSPWTGDVTLKEIVEKYFNHVPLRKPVEELTGLVDISKITQETGWFPLDRLE